MSTFNCDDDLKYLYYSYEGRNYRFESPITREDYIRAAIDLDENGQVAEESVVNTLMNRKYSKITLTNHVVFLERSEPGVAKLRIISASTTSEVGKKKPFESLRVYEIASSLDGEGVCCSTYSDTKREWFIIGTGIVHRENDLPAIIYDGEIQWRVNGVFHRENNKPARIHEDGTKEYYLNGVKYNPTDVPIIDAPVDTPADEVSKDIIAAKNRGCKAVIKLLSAMMNPFNKGELGWIRDILVELGITLADVFEFIIADKDKLASEDTSYRHIAKEIFKARLDDLDRLATNLHAAVSALGIEVVLEMYEPFLLKKKLSEEPVAGRLLHEYCYILSNYPWYDYDFNPFLLRFMKEARDETKIKATRILLKHAK
jgi:hypothetical protein